MTHLPATCLDVQDALLACEDLHAHDGLPAALRAHLAQCPSCQACRDALAALEARVRAPVAGDETPPPALRVRLSAGVAAAPAGAPARVLGRATRWAAAAFIVLSLAAGWLAGRTWHARPAADPGLVDDLVAWNLQISAAAPDLRRAAYDARAAALAARYRRAAIDRREQELAEALLANGAWLVRNNDPIEEAGRFNEIADRLAGGVESWSATGRPEVAANWARTYSIMLELGVEAPLERAMNEPALTPVQALRFQHVEQSSSDQVQRVENLIQRVPPQVRKGLERAVEVKKKHGRDGSHPLPPGQRKKLLNNDSGKPGKGS